MGMRYIFLYSLIYFLIDTLLVFTSTSNTFLYEILTLIEFLLFAGFLHQELQNKAAKKTLLYAVAGFTLFFVAYTYGIKEVKVIDSVPIGVETILILPFAFFLLYEQTNDTSTLFIYNRFTFWIILGIVLYLSGSFFIWIFADTISPEEGRKYWVVTNIFATLKNIFFCIAIYLNSKPNSPTLKSDFNLSSLN